MSVMGFFFYPSKIKQTPRIYSLFITLVGVVVCGVLVSAGFSTSAYAAQAAWTNSSHNQISFGGKTFSGPKTNSKAPGEMAHSGWNPNGDGQDGATYFINGTEAVIWFPKGASTGSSDTANYSKLTNTGANSYSIDGVTQITIGADQTSASLSVVKSIYRTSISDYVNSECQKAFTTNQERSECRSIVNNRFNSCFDGQVNDNSFTFNSSKPGNSIDLPALSSCIASGTDIGRAAQYRDIFSKAADKANSDGSSAYNNAAPTGEIPEGEGEGDSSCQVKGIGWIVCPALTFAAGLVDAAYGFVSSLLDVQPLLTTGQTKPVYDAWKMMRNIANICFVIAFLIIIFSQLTSFGVNNYGIKKLLPRIIVAAILVNVSYWICAIAIDVSNILGTSLKGLLDASSDAIYTPDQQGGIFSGNNPWMNATAVILAGGISLYIGLSAFLPAIIAALLAIVTVFIVLTLRQALIILLVVIAPLAFVALLLPNTESWFKKWRALFQTLLLMYPIIAVIFGASAFASRIVMESSDEIAIQVMGAAISIIPLAITPIVMKTAGGLLNRFGGMVNNPNRGPFDRMRKGANAVRENRKNAMQANRLTPLEGKNRFSRAWRRTAGVGARTNANFKAQNDRNKARAEAAEAGYMMDNAAAQEASQLRMAASAANSARQSQSLQSLDTDAQLAVLGQAGKEDNRSLNAAIRGQIQQGEKQAVSEIEAQIAPESANQLGKILDKAIKEGDTYAAQAAQNKLSTMGNKGASIMEEVIEKREAEGGNANWVGMRTELARNLSGSMMEKSEALKNWAVTTEINRVDGEDKLLKEVDVKDANGNVMRDAQGNIVTRMESSDRSLAEWKKDLVTGKTALSADKFKKQTPATQKALLTSEDNPISADTLKTSLNPNNVSSFDPEIVKMMQDKLVAMEVKQQGEAKVSVDPQPLSSQGTSIPHSDSPAGANPSSARTTAPSSTGFSTAQFEGSGAKIILPDSAIRDIKKASSQPASEAPTVVNNIVNSDQTINQSNTWTPASGPNPQPPSGRRSAGTPFDTPGTSIREPGSDPRYAKPPTPRDNPANIPDPRDFQ